ncbi:MAG: hypothetical protein VX641_01385 [Planctomycetota bacterium]|nr:hypothetical protein [Planctomycetota bacterium]
MHQRQTSPRILKTLVAATSLTMIASALCGCRAAQAYPGPERPESATATLEINPPQAEIGFEVTAVNGHPFRAEENASILPGRTTLDLNVWPTAQITMEESDPAFATMYSMQDSQYSRTVSVTFNAVAGERYGLNGTFNMGASPSDASYSVEVFNLKTMSVLARGGSMDTAQRSDEVIQGVRENRSNQWTVEEGPGS